MIKKMALACSDTEYESRSLYHVHDTRPPDTDWKMRCSHQDQCICTPRGSAETTYLDPRLLTSEGSDWDGEQPWSANRHRHLQADPPFMAGEEAKSNQADASNILPYPCFSVDNERCMTASSPSTSSNPSPRLDDFLQPILTVSEERHLRRKAQNREA